MPAQVPIPSNFSTRARLSIVPPPQAARSSNVLILLHGLGDTEASFSALGRQLCLPETTCISLQALTPLPFELGGFHWGDDIVFDQTSGEMDIDTGFTKSVSLIQKDVISDVLIAKCGYKPRNIILFGFGQGAMAALAVAESLPEELGGVISVGGSLPAMSVNPSTPKTSQTPVLLLGGSSSTKITRTAVETLQKVFKNTEYYKWDKLGDSMPRNREEMLPIMRFFARRLQSRQGVPEGSREVE